MTSPGCGRGSGSVLNLPAPFCGWCRSCEELCEWCSNAGPVCQRNNNSAAACEAGAGVAAGSGVGQGAAQGQGQEILAEVRSANTGRKNGCQERGAEAGRVKRGLVLRAQCPHSSGSEGGPQSPSLGSMGPSAAAPHGTSIVLQEMQLVAQLEEQLQAETKEIKEKKEQERRRGLAFWMKTVCLIFVSLLLLNVAVLGSAVLYAQHYDQELLYRLLLQVLPQAMYASLAYFASRSLRVVCDGLLPI
ncbi:uncharacterized protein LOC112531394 isoform X2 [Gallus gallus]|uniref:uncharacterized protein LOC112531394 isoform X2 n=1 Tax=Gallus gallus TaxID=9031 RepID=UPI001AE2734A|nr:uncharacterized protein LOC112531394 isoform X2 [Gallus gallus]